MCFDFLYNFYLKHFSFQKELSEMLSQMYIGLHVKYPFFLSDFNKIVSTDFRKNTQISNFMKIRPVGVELLHADGQMDGRMEGHDEANSCFSKFCESA